MDLLFVYGTLLRCEPRHHLLAPHLRGACPARVAGSLLDMGAFPALVGTDDHDAWVQGELLLLDGLDALLPILDRVEGCAAPGTAGGLYRRERVEVSAGVQCFHAWAYVLCDGQARGPAIPSGSWRVRGLYTPSEPPTALDGLDEVLRMIPWSAEGPGSAPFLALPDGPGPCETWGGADILVANMPTQPPTSADDPWGTWARDVKVYSPHALALGWLISELMDRVLRRGLACDKYSFFGALAGAARGLLEVQPHAGERALLGAVWSAAAQVVVACGWGLGARGAE